MARTASGARTASAARRKVMHARASIFTDGTDDNGTFTGTAHGTTAHSLLCRLKPLRNVAASNQAAFSIGTNGANAATFLGLVEDAGVRYLGGGVVGTSLHESTPWSPGGWRDAMVSFAGGAGGALKLYLDAAAPLATVASPNIVSTTGRIGSIAGSAGTWFGGLTYDCIEYAREVTQAEYTAWRLDGVVPAGPHRRYTGDDGYGTTLTDTSGNGVNATMVGAIFSPDVPFRRRRVVEDVAAAVGPTNATVPHSAAVDPTDQSWGVGLWFRVDKGGGTFGYLAQKDAGGVGFYFAFSSDVLIIRLRDGVTTITDSSTLKCVDGRWHSAWFVIDRMLGLALWYLDAMRPRTISLGALGSISCPAGVLQLGTAGSVPINGRNDYALVIGRPPTWAEVAGHHFDGVMAPTGAICWPMREASGVTAVSSPAGYDATLVADSHTTATRCHARTAA